MSAASVGSPTSWKLLADIRAAEEELARAESAALGRPRPDAHVERAQRAVTAARDAWRRDKARASTTV